jgi:hypothetical protein
MNSGIEAFDMVMTRRKSAKKKKVIDEIKDFLHKQ